VLLFSVGFSSFVVVIAASRTHFTLGAAVIIVARIIAIGISASVPISIPIIIGISVAVVRIVGAIGPVISPVIGLGFEERIRRWTEKKRIYVRSFFLILRIVEHIGSKEALSYQST
jgi:hypothetical protein